MAETRESVIVPSTELPENLQRDERGKLKCKSTIDVIHTPCIYYVLRVCLSDVYAGCAFRCITLIRCDYVYMSMFTILALDLAIDIKITPVSLLTLKSCIDCALLLADFQLTW